MKVRSVSARLRTTTFRAALLLGSSLAASFIAAACGETGNAELPASPSLDGSSEDGGPSSVSTPDAEVDAAAPNNDAALMGDAASDVVDAEVLTAPRVTMLRPGVSHLHGVTTGSNPHAVYSVQAGNDWQVEAVPIHGGPVSVIGPGYGATLRGGAVGLFRTTAAGTTLTLWTAANGSKPIPTSTTPIIFDATEDGTRAVIGFADGQGKTDVAITSTATPSTTPTFSGVRAVDYDPPYFKFHGTRLVTWHENTERSVRRIVTVDVGGAPVIRRQDVGAAPDSWLVLADVDRTGTTALIWEGSSYWLLPLGGNGFARPFPAGSPPQTVPYQSGFTPDGTKYVFTGADERLYVSSVSAVPTRTDLGIANVFQVWIAPNSQFALVRAQPATHSYSMTTIDLSKPVPAPITWLTDQGGFDARCLGSGARVVFADFTPYNEKTMSAASGGGDQRTLSTDAGLYAVAPVGSAVLFMRQMANEPPYTHELLYVDGAVGGAPTPIPGVVNPSDHHWSNKSLVLIAAAGLFTVDVP